MVNLIHCGIDKFIENTSDKKLCLFGAGRRARHLCDSLDLESAICKVIDNDDKLKGNTFTVNKKSVPIIGVEDFVDFVARIGLENIQLVITNAFYAWDIIKQLDNIGSLDGLVCYDMNLLMDYKHNEDFKFTKGTQKIPKKIHYCWFGENQIPARLQKCIDSWKKYCPDYEIIRWDETNYDIMKNRYMKEAYENKKWGFVSDYARLDIIYQEGGIYLDTDVELISDIDKVLCDEAFFAADSNLMINLGQGFGAKKANLFIRELRDFYEGKQFINTDGTFNTAPCYMYQHPVFIKHGFEMKNQYQKKNGIVIYPSEVSAPTGRCGIWQNFTKNTISIHHNEFSWVEKEEHQHYEEYKKNILNRIGRE